MGLHVSSISSLPLSEERDYYLYVLDYYNWDEPVSKSLKDNEDKIASFCAANNAVMVRGLPDSHFASEVLSWVKVDGQDPYLILPALLITATHPKYFIEANEKEPNGEIGESLIFLKIRDLCKSPSDVVQLLEKIFSDIRKHKKIRDFAITKELRAKEHGALVDALILEPNIGGVGLDVKKLVSWIASRIKSH